MNSEVESEAENEAIENGVDNDLQTLSIVASGLFFPKDFLAHSAHTVWKF